ncbi:MAG: hypothetical protein K0R15_1504 [Clostridiales bacterium]|jgi:2-dehydro-3-deoxyphosphogluconate aldolase/(4S)-4-hydroxy-2-oxoglutarate aldolase|nr:hypothetical protein [Clostridiales bacterium]
MEQEGLNMKQEVLSSILEKKIVAILRGLDYEENFKVMESLVEVGITNFEVTLNTPKALVIIEEALKKFDKSAFIGAGTVRNKEDALNAVNAGAQFLITPNLNEDCIEVADRNNILISPGVFSPTEIARAYEYGCELVKLFPAAVLGSDYVNQLMGPFRDIKIMAVGGIDLLNINSYLHAGVQVFGLGSSLINSDLIKSGNYEQLKVHFQKYIELINK